MNNNQMYLDEAQISKGKAQWREVSSPQLFNFPNNVIGSLIATIKASNQ